MTAPAEHVAALLWNALAVVVLFMAIRALVRQR
jgi:hypothetical protein